MKYNQTVDACALLPDFKIFSAGDQTEIGEKVREPVLNTLDRPVW